MRHSCHPAPCRHRALAPIVAAACLAVTLLLSAGPATAIDRATCREIRDRYEGHVLRLRVDLRPATTASDPNVVSLEGVGYARERTPALFGRMETVYVQRIVSEGGSRLGLTVYRSREDADRIRASAVPQPTFINPAAGSTLANFARQDGTSVLLELKAGKKEPAKQLEEIETLLDRLFYLKSEPGREEMEDFVRGHSGMPLSRLRALTGLDPDRIRELLKEAPAGAPAQ